jgi:hypothetical protein
MALLDLILALHKCRRFQATAADEECYAGALPDLLTDVRGCCATKNASPAAAAAGGGDYEEEDEACADGLVGLLAELTAAAAPLSPYARCIAQCSAPPHGRPGGAGRCRAHRARPCKAAVRVLVVAFEGIAAAAHTLFARERPPDMTVDARNLVTLCADLAANDDVDTDRCLGRIKGVLKHSHGQIKYRW